MTCQTAAFLRFAWYSTCHQYGAVLYPFPKVIKTAINRERKSPEYQQALEALREHLKGCEVCQQSKPME